MMLKILFIISLVSFGAAQSINQYHEVDSLALNVPQNKVKSIKLLSNYLTAPFTSQENKARALFRWVTENIEYDVKSYLSGAISSTSDNDVLKRRSSVCDGYASLFESLGKQAGLEIRKISGYAKGYGYSIGDRIAGKSNHAWNAVKINGEWKLIDCTWGAGYLGPNHLYQKSFDDHYFFTNPEEFIYGHFPDDSKWQFLTPALSAKQFEALPYYKSNFFSLRIQESEARAIISSEKEIVLRYSAPDNVLFMASLSKNAIDVPSSTFIQPNGNSVNVLCAPPGAGEYSLLVFAKRKEVKGSYNQIAEYKIHYDGLPFSGLIYPGIFSSYVEKGAVAYSPISGSLQSSERQLFKILVPGAEKVAVVIGDEWEFLDNNRGVFEKIIEIGTGKIVVMARYPGSSTFEGLLEYYGAGEHAKTEAVIKYKVFLETGGEIITPKVKRLKSETKQKFLIKLPGALEAVVVINDHWNHLTLHNDTFVGEIELRKGKIIVYGLYPGNEQYQGLLEYVSE